MVTIFVVLSCYSFIDGFKSYDEQLLSKTMDKGQISDSLWEMANEKPPTDCQVIYSYYKKDTE